MQKQKVFDVGIRGPDHFGLALRRIRMSRKMTQKELAVKAGIQQTTVSKVENGQRGTELSTIFAICAVLDLELVVRPRKKSDEVDFQEIFRG